MLWMSTLNSIPATDANSLGQSIDVCAERNLFFRVELPVVSNPGLVNGREQQLLPCAGGHAA